MKVRLYVKAVKAAIEKGLPLPWNIVIRDDQGGKMAFRFDEVGEAARGSGGMLELGRLLSVRIEGANGDAVEVAADT
jgi:hypothetical protein